MPLLNSTIPPPPFYLIKNEQSPVLSRLFSWVKYLNIQNNFLSAFLPVSHLPELNGHQVTTKDHLLSAKLKWLSKILQHHYLYKTFDCFVHKIQPVGGKILRLTQTCPNSKDQSVTGSRLSEFTSGSLRKLPISTLQAIIKCYKFWIELSLTD